MSIWRYKLEKAEIIKCNALLGITFNNSWGDIEGGQILIGEGYAWDGCSPAVPVFNTGFWLGTPDGQIGKDGKPVTWRASLVHDFLCQFRRDINGLTKNIATEAFREMLQKSNAPKWMVKLYPWAVDKFGYQKGFKGEN